MDARLPHHAHISEFEPAGLDHIVRMCVPGLLLLLLLLRLRVAAASGDRPRRTHSGRSGRPSPRGKARGRRRRPREGRRRRSLGEPAVGEAAASAQGTAWVQGVDRAALLPESRGVLSALAVGGE